MADKSRDKCLQDNDFESALERYERTTQRWKEYWWECLTQIYERVKDLSKKYVLDPVKKIVSTLKDITDVIVYKTNFLDDSFSEKVYLFKFYDAADNLLFSKVGTTKRYIATRLKEEIRTYRKNFAVNKATIESVYNCGELPAEGAESFCRALFIKEYPNTFQKNDRFMGVDIPVSKFNEIVERYLA